jgi:hypothetical protein
LCEQELDVCVNFLRVSSASIDVARMCSDEVMNCNVGQAPGRKERCRGITCPEMVSTSGGCKQQRTRFQPGNREWRSPNSQVAGLTGGSRDVVPPRYHPVLILENDGRPFFCQTIRCHFAGVEGGKGMELERSCLRSREK